jgi:hypothetical protein
MTSKLKSHNFVISKYKKWIKSSMFIREYGAASRARATPPYPRLDVWCCVTQLARRCRLCWSASLLTCSGTALPRRHPAKYTATHSLANGTHRKGVGSSCADGLICTCAAQPTILAWQSSPYTLCLPFACAFPLWAVIDSWHRAARAEGSFAPASITHCNWSNTRAILACNYIHMGW